jgi:hypothetical protein
MEEREKKSGGSGCAIGCLLMGLLLPALYVLSSGPALGLIWRGYLPAEFLAIYSPLQWTCDNSQSFGKFLTWYKNLFRPPVTLS